MQRRLRALKTEPITSSRFGLAEWIHFLALVVSPFIVEHMQRGREQGLQEGQKEGLSKGLSKGRREAAVRSLPTVLRVRNIDVPNPLHQRILGEKNVARLEHWLERAATAQTVEEVFAELS